MIMPGVSNRGTWREKAEEDTWEFSVLIAQSFCKPKTVSPQKKYVINFKKHCHK
jgi:hypothetical protein